VGLLPYKNEPYIDWSDKFNRKTVRSALKEVGNSLEENYPLR
jgi:1-pyrroline-5-carboxylate dehydrogenase